MNSSLKIDLFYVENIFAGFYDFSRKFVSYNSLGGYDTISHSTSVPLQKGRYILVSVYSFHQKIYANNSLHVKSKTRIYEPIVIKECEIRLY